MKKIIILLLVSLTVFGNTKKQVKNYIYSHPNIKYKHITFKMFCIETSNFKSELFLKANNIAGIKKNSSIYSNGSFKGYARYYIWTNSIEDFIRIQKKIILKYSPKNEGEYITALYKYGYFQDTQYKSKLKQRY